MSEKTLVLVRKTNVLRIYDEALCDECIENEYAKEEK